MQIVCSSPCEMSRKNNFDACALFCDNFLNGECHHTRTKSLLNSAYSGSFDESHTTEDANSTIDKCNSISSLPLAPVNCAKSLQADELSCTLARNSQPFVLKAPRIALSVAALETKQVEIFGKMGP